MNNLSTYSKERSSRIELINKFSLFKLNIFFLLFLFSCSDATSTNREKAIEKQTEAVTTYIRAYHQDHAHKDSLLQIANNLIDESIALDSTYILAYFTKLQYLNLEKKYEEGLEVLQSAFRIHLEEQDTGFYLYRGLQYDMLNKPELARRDYEQMLGIFEERLKSNPDEFFLLSTKAVLITLIKGLDAGIKDLEKLSERSLSSEERLVIDEMLKALKTYTRREQFVEDFI